MAIALSVSAIVVAIVLAVYLHVRLNIMQGEVSGCRRWVNNGVHQIRSRRLLILDSEDGVDLVQDIERCESPLEIREDVKKWLNSRGFVVPRRGSIVHKYDYE